MRKRTTTRGAGARRRTLLEAIGRDSGVAMMSSILLVLIMASLSMVVLALVMAQTRPTEFARKNTRTIFAAEAGVEAALSRIRSAGGAADFTGAVYGDLTQLPCTLSGTVADATGELRYSVQVRYYKDDPAGQSATWLANNKMTGCRPATQPAYAYISAQGFSETTPRLSADEADRSLSSVYQFNTTNSNINGGRIYTFGDQYCLRADNTTVGSTITYVPKDQCGADDDRELWVYDADYKLKLSVSTLPGGKALCIGGDPRSGSVQAKLQECTTDASRWQQLWSWDTGARWRGENDSITDYSGSCLFAGTTNSGAINGAKLHIGSCASDQAWGSFNPDPAVGAGGAKYETIQIVNYLEFGRCFDVTDQTVGSAFMIVYPCKQDPTGGSKLNWNHKWYYSEPPVGQSVLENQRISVRVDNNTSKTYCLQAPGAGGTYVTLTSSCSTTAPAQQWDRYQNTGNSANSYTFVDYLGRCVGLSDDKYKSAWSKIVVTSCSGEADQKWNAPPQKSDAQIGDYVEGTRP
ncbi:ricin-type beta-trefoil lectin domain protein [Cellulomonas sp. NPDC058312]|jgi:Tfp pilus assembly protein PilX|uniref:ricin-type beta-trefoil lectin domain protein n=1 Tax=Cellulomonas sp. NPDC058312 TaxID=3346441 RepID=UPI0036EA97E5